MAHHHSGPAARPEAMGQGEGKIRCSHLLVKHRESRRPSSWREAEITRSKEEAIQILQGHEERIKSGEVSLGDIAVSESDCSSARKRGDLYVHRIILPLSVISANFLSVVSSDATKCRKNLKMRHLLYSPAKSVALLTLLLAFISLNGNVFRASNHLEEANDFNTGSNKLSRYFKSLVL